MNLDTNALGDASDPLQGLPQWARASTELRDYYLREWGVPVTSETGVFERLSLEVFQAGLSWATILRKRDAFREVFAGFEPDAVAALTDTDVSRLMSDSRIVRNRRKIEATVANARATIALREHTSLPTLVLQHAPGVLDWLHPRKQRSQRALSVLLPLPTRSVRTVFLWWAQPICMRSCVRSVRSTHISSRHTDTR